VTPWMGITASTGAGMPSSTWRLAAAMICVLRPMIDRARGRIARAWLEQTGMRHGLQGQHRRGRLGCCGLIRGKGRRVLPRGCPEGRGPSHLGTFLHTTREIGSK